ncbi:unnamed protein product, partial [Mesorhabditis belari]|uniref:Uncharacterized protein n=1 Tax=Mesorhabditis belari TaxID=2138241 RepID=A0AAF3J7W3_9BILA
MTSLNHGWPIAFWTLLALSLVEACLFVWHGVILGVLPLSTSLLLLLSLAPPKEPTESLRSFFWKLVAGVVLVGVVFVNCTHALELLTEQIGPTDNHHHGHNEAGQIPISYLMTAVVDALLKGFFVFSGRTPTFGYRHSAPIFALLCTPAIAVACVAGGTQFLHSDLWLWEHLVPISTLVLSGSTIALIIPYFKYLKDYIFHSAPETFNVNTLKEELHSKLSQVRIRHCHVFRVWPRGAVEAHFRLSIEVNKQDQNWGKEGEKVFEEANRFIREHLVGKCESNKIVIEPHFVDRRSPKEEKYPICVNGACQSKRLTCCSPEEISENCGSAKV